MEAYIYICGSRALATDYKSLKRNIGDDLATHEERIADFARRHYPGFRTWLFQNCKRSNGVRRQQLYITHIAKFYGLSRTGIHILSRYDMLSPLTTMDRDISAKLLEYTLRTRYQKPESSIVVCACCG